jgi:CheY-like chemotaxis protein
MRRILVVDDEPDVAELMRLFLGLLGYEADIFPSCEESLKAVGEKRYWAVFCDYMMPKITGDLLYREVKALDSALAGRFVLITGAMLDEHLESFLQSERVKVISKPFNLGEIKKTLAEMEAV